MELADRIRMARRKIRLTQQALADALQVNRSAVANWESGGASPSAGNLQRLAKACEVSYEWLATGRGDILLPGHVHDVPAAHALLVEDPAEMRLVEAFRRAPPRVKLILLDLSELQVKPPPPPDARAMNKPRRVAATAAPFRQGPVMPGHQTTPPCCFFPFEAELP